MRIKKGDQVKILAGRDRGKIGKVTAVLIEAGRITVEGMNTAKKRMKPRKQGQKGETIAIAHPLQESNVMLVCPNCKKATRIGARVEGKEKYRFCKKCDARI